MIFNTKIEEGREQAFAYLKWVSDKGSIVKITETNMKTELQNRYLHLILSYFAVQTGNTLEYVKQIVFKQYVNLDIFLGEVPDRNTGEMKEYIKSTAQLSRRDMSKAITKFLNYSSIEANIDLPSPKDYEKRTDMIIEMSNEIEKNKEYL